jgi:hypothetical protein
LVVEGDRAADCRVVGVVVRRERMTMSAKEYVRSLEEWLGLTELSLPTLKSDTDKGMVRKVFKVGFVLVSSDDCANKGIQAHRGPGGKCLLPTAVVEADGDPLCQNGMDNSTQ